MQNHLKNKFDILGNLCGAELDNQTQYSQFKGFRGTGLQILLIFE